MVVRGVGGFHEDSMLKFVSVGEKIKYVLKLTAFDLVDFCIGAPCAGNSCEMFILNIEYFGPESSGSSKLIFMIFPVVALWAPVFTVFHDFFISNLTF